MLVGSLFLSRWARLHGILLHQSAKLPFCLNLYTLGVPLLILMAASTLQCTPRCQTNRSIFSRPGRSTRNPRSQARDSFYQCVREQGREYTPGSEVPAKCTALRNAFLKSCPASWVRPAVISRTVNRLSTITVCFYGFEGYWRCTENACPLCLCSGSPFPWLLSSYRTASYLAAVSIPTHKRSNDSPAPFCTLSSLTQRSAIVARPCR